MCDDVFVDQRKRNVCPMKMKRHEIVALARAQIAHQNAYLERTIFANDFRDDDIDYAVSTCCAMTTLVDTLVCDENMNAADDDEIDVSAMMNEMCTYACDGICREIHDNAHFAAAVEKFEND